MQNSLVWGEPVNMSLMEQDKKWALKIGGGGRQEKEDGPVDKAWGWDSGDHVLFLTLAFLGDLEQVTLPVYLSFLIHKMGII